MMYGDRLAQRFRPRVFSNHRAARITWSPQLAGGPEASQNGIRQRLPAKTAVRSAILRFLGLRG